jgi:DNA-binding NtrC family response regulator
VLAKAVLYVPALRDRPAELQPLAEHALERVMRQLGRPGLVLGRGLREALGQYGWPGNVRELLGALAQAALSAESDELRVENLPPRLVDVIASGQQRSPTGAPPGTRTEDLRQALRAAEKDALLRALAQTHWNVAETARRLGLPRRTVVYRMSRLGLRRPGRAGLVP